MYYMVSHNTKSHVIPHIDQLDIRNAMVPLMILMMSCYAGAGTNGITWPKSHFAPHFNCLDLRNSVVLLGMLLVSHDTNSGTTWCWQWYHWCQMTKESHFHLIMIILTLGLHWFHWEHHWHHIMLSQCQWCHMTKRTCCTSFQSAWPKDCSGASGDAADITWHWCWCQWHQMTNKIILHLISVILI